MYGTKTNTPSYAKHGHSMSVVFHLPHVTTPNQGHVGSDTGLQEGFMENWVIIKKLIISKLKQNKPENSKENKPVKHHKIIMKT
jgi:hypothetical protein